MIRRLLGQVCIRVESAFPERLLNLCSAHNLAFWDLAWETPSSFTCRISRQDFKVLRQAAKNLDCTLSVVRREGAPYFFLRFRNRPALLSGVVGCALALFLGSFFVWDFTVEGNETVPRERILRALEQTGVGIGSFGLTLDGEDIRNHVLLELPELSWITVNVSGCRAQVQVRERVAAPELVSKRTPSNIVARRAGLVLKIQTLGGIPCVLKGSSVEKGQLLISGIEDTDTFGARIKAGLGRVEGRTWYQLTAQVPLEVQQKQYTGKRVTGAALVFGTHRIKFYANSSIEGAKYDKITQRKAWSIFGFPLPVTLETEQFRFYETAVVRRTAQTAQLEAADALAAYLESIVSPYGAVEASRVSSRERGDVLTVTLRAECREEIGQSVPIYLDDKS